MKKRRENSFFGIHFDFHASNNETIASIYKPDIIEKLLDKVKPDFVQCDTKGFDGISSYPTKVGTPAIKINEDVLRMWRTLTQKRDIALYAHHAGLFDKTVIKNHPKWAIKDEKGVSSTEIISPFSPYADEILIPQLKEIAIEYKLDGAWIDGDCWITSVDYSYYAVKDYFNKTGKNPPTYGDDDYENYRDFCRKGFRDYVRKYIGKMRTIAPEFQITSNWLFSSAYMPEKPDIKIDFLSGDYSCFDSVASARYHGRCIGNQKIPWDLLAWGQTAVPNQWRTPNRNTKEYIQYCQEASEVIALGGAYEFYNLMYGGGGYIQEWAIPIWEKVSQFVRKREKICFKSTPIYEIAVLLPEEKTNQNNQKLYIPIYNGFISLCSWIDAIQNIQYSCNVLNEYSVNEYELNKFKVVVIPNCDTLKSDTVNSIINYIKNGGNVICDINSNKYFSSITEMNNVSTEERLIFLNGNNSLAALDTTVLSHNYKNKISSGEYYIDNFFDNNSFNASILTEYGKGKIINLCFNFSTSYKNNVTTAIESFIKSQFNIINFTPVVEVLNNTFIDVITMQKNGNLVVNLINYSGNHQLNKIRSYGNIPPLYNIDLIIHSSIMPKRVTIEPEHIDCNFNYENNKILLTVDKIDVHKVVVVEL